MTSNLKAKFGLITVFAAITVWALVSGYDQVFSVFAPYDDEGYLMLTVREFLNGGVLYNEVYTQYGPAYYLYEWLLHNISGLPVTHDLTRLTTLAIWTLTAMLCGVFTFRLTRSTFFSAISYILSFVILFRTVSEPGHPQELCGLLIVLILLMFTDGKSGRNSYLRLSISAILLAALCLIKINLGIFVGLGSAIALLTFSEDNRWRRGALYALTAIAILLPFLLFRKYFAVGWLKLCVLIAVMIISAVINGSLNRKNSEIFAKHYLLMAAAFGATIVLIILFVWLKGTTFDALLQGILLQNLKFGDDFFQPAPIQRYAIIWGIIVLAVAAALAFFRQKDSLKVTFAANLLKTGFGFFVVLCSLFGYAKFLNTFLLLSFAAPLLWLLTIESSSAESTRTNQLAKTVLIFIAVLLTLQIFPIAGTQMAYGSFLISIAGVICLSDGLSNLQISLPQKFPSASLLSGLKTVAAITLLLFCVKHLHDNYTVFNQNVPVKFNGTNRVRLPEKDAAFYNFLVENLTSECDGFISMPGIYSLNFWTRIEPPTTFNATAWMTLLNESQQQATIEKLKNYRRVCAVYNPQLTQNGLRNRDLETIPLAAYILQNFQNQGTVNGYRLMTGNGTVKELAYSAKIIQNQPNLVTFTLSSNSEWTISRIQLFNTESSRIIADSQTTPFSIFDHAGKSAMLPLIISRSPEVSRQTSVKFDSLNPNNLSPPENLVLRIFDDRGNLSASLPFVEAP